MFPTRSPQRLVWDGMLVVRAQLQSNLDFGPVVKPLGITVKKEAGKVVETSAVVRSHATRGY